MGSQGYIKSKGYCWQHIPNQDIQPFGMNSLSISDPTSYRQGRFEYEQVKVIPLGVEPTMSK